TTFTLRVAAPAGQHFLAHEAGTLTLQLRLEGVEMPEGTLLPANTVGLSLDGVPVTATFIGHGYEDHSFNEFTFYADLDVAPGMTFSEVVLTFDYALLQGDLPPGPQVVSEAYALVFQRERSDATENSLG